MQSLGERIKKRRQELNLTQEELAKLVGYTSKSTINKIEKNVNDITRSKVISFAKALNVTPAYLMGWEDNEQDAGKIISKIYNDESHNLSNMVKTLGFTPKLLSHITSLDEYIINSWLSEDYALNTKYTAKIAEAVLLLKVLAEEDTNICSTELSDVITHYKAANLKDKNMARVALDLNALDKSIINNKENDQR